MRKLILIVCFVAAGGLVLFISTSFDGSPLASSPTASAGGAQGGGSDSSPPDAADEETADTSAVAEVDARKAILEEGRRVFVAGGCDVCHTVYEAGIGQPEEGASARGNELDLSSLGEMRAPEWVRAYLRKEVALDGAEHYRAFKGTEQEEDALIEWLVRRYEAEDAPAVEADASGESAEEAPEADAEASDEGAEEAPEADADASSGRGAAVEDSGTDGSNGR